MKRILVLGIGNVILRDEGIGIHVVQKIDREHLLPPEIEVLDGGTGGYFLVHDVMEYEHVILIDATLDEYPEGHVRVIHPRFSSDYPPMLSAHEFGLKHLIDAMIFLERIPVMHLVLISVRDFQEVGLDLTPVIADAIPRVLTEVNKLIKEISLCPSQNQNQPNGQEKYSGHILKEDTRKLEILKI